MPSNILLKVEKISKKYSDKVVFTDISFSLSAGEIFALVGASGAGKSTLLHCLNFLEIPDSGEVFISSEKVLTKTKKDGTRIIANKKQIRRLRQKIALVFQSPHLWSHWTARENIIAAQIYGKKIAKNIACEKADFWLNRLQMSDKSDTYPSQLSGGQAQRVAIARALAFEAEILLLDEPTSALDEKLTETLAEILEEQKENGKAILIASHDKSFLREIADKYIEL
ncbi:MAG: amino acid ABC transporter ATP-binding protein [Cardiobacteriaceae bacterium]|nr:amino acid ABC transporter ATP-binding protein [Cardiobacteriaceae bacterium]